MSVRHRARSGPWSLVAAAAVVVASAGACRTGATQFADGRIAYATDHDLRRLR